MANSPIQPVRAILDNDQLPTPVHEYANAWRALDERENDASEALADATTGHAQAVQEDRQAATKAIEAGKPVPVPVDAHEVANLAAAAAADVTLELIRYAKVKSGNALLTAMLASRDEFVTMTAATVRAAAATHLDALDKADTQLRATVAALAMSTIGLGTIDDLDAEPRNRYEVGGAAANLFGVDTSAARAELRDLLTRVDLLVEPVDRLTVRSTSGDYLEMPTAAALYAVHNVGAVIVDPTQVPADAHVTRRGLPDSFATGRRR